MIFISFSVMFLCRISKIMLIDSSGNVVVRYTYDAWGNHTVRGNDGAEIAEATHIGNINPIRYRGYYYDTEIGLYYLQTRYYDPTTGRFVTIDGIAYADPESINGLNLYAYCGNNPVMNVDPTGTMPNWLKWLLGGLVIIGLGIATIATGGAAAGVAGFIVAGALKGAIIGAISGALISGTIGGITSVISGNGFWSGFADGAADGFMSGAIIGAITGAISSGVKVFNAAKLWDKGNFKSGFQSMIYHYKTHVLNEGFKTGNNIVKYTKDAISFASRNAKSLKFVVPYNTTLQPHWTFIGKVGMNGQFTAGGNILTFWYINL